MRRIIFLTIIIFNLPGCLHGPSLDTSSATVWCLNVGYGDALVLHSQGQTVVIDGGYPVFSDFLVDFLNSHHYMHIDALVITHPHPDHIGGAYGIIASEFTIDHIYGIFPLDDPRNPEGFRQLITFKNMDYCILRRGDRVSIWDGFAMEILHPDKIVSDLNDSSMVLKVTLLDRVILLTGDIGIIPQQALADQYGDGIKCDILKAPHHGGWGIKSFLHAADPDIILLSVGKNPYGNPRPETVNDYLDTGAKLLRTDRDGSIRLDWKPSSPIRIERDSVPRGTLP